MAVLVWVLVWVVDTTIIFADAVWVIVGQVWQSLGQIGVVSLRAMTALAVTAALVELNTFVAEVVVGTIGSGDAEVVVRTIDSGDVEVVVRTIGSGDVEVGVMFAVVAIVAIVMGVGETVLLLCMGPSVNTAVDVEIEVTVTTTVVPGTVTVDTSGESVVVVVSKETVV